MGIKEASASAAEKLLGWAFANADTVTPIGVLGQNTTAAASSALVAQTTETQSPADAALAAVPTNTVTAGSNLDGLAIGWMLLFAAIIAFILFGVKSAFTTRKNRNRLTNKGKVSLEG